MTLGQSAPASSPADAARQSYAAHLAAANSALRLNEPAEARRWLNGAPAALRGWEWRYLQATLDESLATIRLGDETAYCVAINKSGDRIAAGDAAGRLHVLSYPECKSLLSIDAHKGPIYGVAFSVDGRRIGTASGDRTARVWDAASGKLFCTFTGHTTPVTNVAFVPGGDFVATSNYRFDGGNTPAHIKGTIHFWKPVEGDTATIEKTLSAGIKPCSSLRFSADGRWLALGSWDGFVAVWQAPFDGEPRILKLPDEDIYNAVNAVTVSPDGKWVACGSKDRTARVWRTADSELVATLRGHAGFVTGAAFSPDGNWLATVGEDAMVRMWDTRAWSERVTLRGHAQAGCGVAWTPDGTRLLTVSTDGTLRTWAALYPHTDGLSVRYERTAVYTAQFSPDGTRIAGAAYDGFIRIWNARSGAVEAEWEAHPGKSCNTLAYSGDGRRMVSCSWDKTAKVWDAESHSLLAEFKEDAGIYHCAISRDGRFVATTGGVWNVEKKKIVVDFADIDGGVSTMAISPDGQWVLTAGRGPIMHLINIADEKKRRVLATSRGSLSLPTFSANGRYVAAAAGGAVLLWDAESGDLLRVVHRGDANITRLAFSPDGKRLAATSNVLSIIDVEHGGELLALRPHKDTLWHVSWSPDGARLASCCWDGSARVLESTPLRLRGVGNDAVMTSSSAPATRPAGDRSRGGG